MPESGLTPRFVDDARLLVETCAEFDLESALAFDTEFERSRTYYAELCLVQIADAGAPVCVDTLALADLAPLARVLNAGGGPRIAHAARQDLEVLLQRTGGLPACLFDTQIAAALCGHSEQIGYAELVRLELGVQLAKSATRTDWRQRPLSNEQLEYAADDVRYLPPLAAALDARLVALGRRAWLDEECAALCEPALYQVAPADAWRRLKGLQHLPDAARARAASLAAWREETARARNLPRNWVLKDSALLDLARLAPSGLRALAGLDLLEPGTLRRHGAAILDALAAGADAPPVTARPTTAGREVLKRWSAALEARAAELAVAPAVLATRAELEALLCGRVVPRLRSGWRATALAGALEPDADSARLCE